MHPFGCRIGINRVIWGYVNNNVDAISSGTNLNAMNPNSPNKPTTFLPGVHENVVDYTAIVAFGLTASWSIGSTSNSYVVSAASPVCGSAAAAAVIENLIVPLSVVDMEDPVSESSVETLSTASTHIAERPQESKSFYVEVYLGVPPKPVRLELNLRERGLAVLPSAFPYQQSSVNSPVSASSPLCLSGKPAPSNSNYCFSEADDQSWSGVQYRDAISFGGPSIMSNLTIVSLPSDTPSPFHHSSVGSLGLAATSEGESVMTELQEQKLLAWPEFGLCAGSQGSVLSLGRPSGNLVDLDTLQFLPLVSPDKVVGYQVGLEAIQVGGVSLTSPPSSVLGVSGGAILDSLLAGISFAPSVYNELQTRVVLAVPAAQQAAAKNLFVTGSSTSSDLVSVLPSVAVVISTESGTPLTATFSAQQYLMQQPSGEYQLLLVRSMHQIDGTILGNLFLQSYYFHFDPKNQRLGVGQPTGGCSLGCNAHTSQSDCASDESCGWCASSSGEGTCTEGDSSSPSSLSMYYQCAAPGSGGVWTKSMRSVRSLASPSSEGGSGDSNTFALAVGLTFAGLAAVALVVVAVVIVRRIQAKKAAHNHGPRYQTLHEERGDLQESFLPVGSRSQELAVN